MSWALHTGDCLDWHTGLSMLGDQSVDHVITDPPYEAEAHTLQRRTKVGGWRAAAARGEADGVARPAPLPFDAISPWQRWLTGLHIARITRRWALVFCQVEASHLWKRALKVGGLDYVRTMVWIKPGAQPQFSGDRPGMGYESIVVGHRPGRKRWNGGGKVGVFTHPPVRTADGSFHPTTKPLPLMRELVELFTDEDELICDPFAGSGSTGVAACMLGRSFVGWELSEEYAEIARRRLRGDEAKPDPRQPSLFGEAT